MLSQAALDEFKQLYKTEFGIDLNDEAALELAVNYITFVSVIYRPVKKVWLDNYENDHEQEKI